MSLPSDTKRDSSVRAFSLKLLRKLSGAGSLHTCVGWVERAERLDMFVSFRAVVDAGRGGLLSNRNLQRG